MEIEKFTDYNRPEVTQAVRYMSIHLKLLDQLPKFKFDKIVPVYLLDDSTPIGTCEITRNLEGGHRGLLSLIQSVPLDYFVYYLNRTSDTPSYYLTGLLFGNFLMNGQDTSQYAIF